MPIKEVVELLERHGLRVPELPTLSFDWLKPRHRQDSHPNPKNRMRGRGRYTGAVLRAIRAVHGVGRPPNPLSVKPYAYARRGLTLDKLTAAKAICQPPALFDQITSMMGSGMSQRATARALGIHLSKLQRTLAKGQLAVA